MNIDDGFRDLAPLDPSRDGERWERMVAGITAAAAPELARRARTSAPGPILLLSGWMRPTAAAATVVAAASALFLATTPPATTGTGGETLGEALGHPAAIAAWVETGAAPSVEEMLLALEGEAR